jgi:hypothetical protein
LTSSAFSAAFSLPFSTALALPFLLSAALFEARSSSITVMTFSAGFSLSPMGHPIESKKGLSSSIGPRKASSPLSSRQRCENCSSISLDGWWMVETTVQESEDAIREMSFTTSSPSEVHTRLIILLHHTVLLLCIINSNLLRLENLNSSSLL